MRLRARLFTASQKYNPLCASHYDSDCKRISTALRLKLLYSAATLEVSLFSYLKSTLMPQNNCMTKQSLGALTHASDIILFKSNL